MSPTPSSMPTPYDLRSHRPSRRWRPLALIGGVVALAMLAGSAGHAWLGTTEAVSGDERVQVGYARVVRRGAPQTLQISVRGEPGKVVKLILSGPLLRKSTVEGVEPVPQASLGEGKALLLHLSDTGSEPRRVVVTLRSQAVGRLSGTLRAGPGSVVRLNTYRYP
ncbi:hypothetical protein [Pseudomonas sp.]|uniref:hypothetical protein n=1 Tax=Pseudomonas sp. TaxID=306 RepID=UPI0028B2346D|nr:hypothetical protein [Pseudomonas sp.]